jgi:hypothetical protein
MRVLSFDVGTRNLAFCEAQFEGGRLTALERWRVVDVRGATTADTVRNVLRLLIDAFTDAEPDAVLVENQPRGSAAMKTVQDVLHAPVEQRALLGDGVGEVVLMSAGAKLQLAGAQGVSYRQGKAACVAWAQRHLTEVGLADRMPTGGKRDDLCDCLAQAAAYARRRAEREAAAAARHKAAAPPRPPAPPPPP